MLVGHLVPGRRRLPQQQGRVLSARRGLERQWLVRRGGARSGQGPFGLAVWRLMRAGRYDQAAVEGKDAVDLEPGYDRARATLGWAYLLSGRKDEGLVELEEAVAISPGNTMWLGQLGEANAMAGNTAKARTILRELEKRERSAFVSPYHIAYVYTGLGEFDRAMDLLEQAVAERTGPAYSIKGSFLLAPLHAHPRFRALLRQMKLE